MSNNIFNRYIEDLNILNENKMLREIPQIHQEGKYIHYNGKRMLNLSSNDYLGIFQRDDLREEFLTFINNFNKTSPLFSSASSRLLTGNSNSYQSLEELLANILNKESALLFNSGYHANSGILPALCNNRSLIIADKLVHASIIDGIKLAGCQFIRYKHNDTIHLTKILEKEHSNYQTIFIVTEGVFSMRGDKSPIKEIVKIKNNYNNTLLYVDEAHSFGTIGHNGLGVCQEEDVLDSVDLYVATFGKAISSMGAFVACNKVIRDYLVNKMRPLIFSTALPPINIEWSKFIISRLNSFNNQREKLVSYSKLLQKELNISNPSNTQILSFITKDAKEAVNLSGRLKEKGVYALPVRPPTVPENECGIRISLTASLTEQDIDLIINAFK